MPASVPDRKLVLPRYQVLRRDAPAHPVVTMNKAIWPLETMLLSELVTSSTAEESTQFVALGTSKQSRFVASSARLIAG